jgi:CRP-like cAMP-binding protein
VSSQKDASPFADNRILSRLPRADYERLRTRLEAVRLPRGRVLFDEGDAPTHAYFLTGGMASLLAAAGDGSTVQVAMVGGEGVVGVPALLGVGLVPYRVVVQLPATAKRISAAALKAEFNRGGPLHDLLLRYLHTLITQVTQSALCNRYHTIEQRLCRWLLISRDRARSDTLELTQESLAHMLGSQRTGVTGAAVALQRRGLIGYRRGRINVLDVRGLEGTSCECYGVISRVIEEYLAA